MRKHILFVALFAALTVTSAASAGSTRITKADATAAYYNTPNGTADPDARVLAVAGSPWDGTHVCALDCHAFEFVWTSEGTRSEAVTTLGSPTASFFIDGLRQKVTEMPLRPFHSDPESWGFLWGVVLEIPPGAHTFSVTLDGDTPAYPFTDSIVFFVDAVGTGACVA